jgi:glutaredoxin 3
MAQSKIGQEPSPSTSGKSPQVEIYTWQFCPFCIRAKGLLDRKGVVYSEYRIDGDEEARRNMALRATGRTSVPQVFINNMGLGGCDELHALERSGELDVLLGRQA